MADQVPHVPPWTGIDICFESALSGGFREEFGISSNGCDVLGYFHKVLPVGRVSDLLPFAISNPGLVRFYSLPTTWASTCDIWSWGLNSTILTASSTTTV